MTLGRKRLISVLGVLMATLPPAAGRAADPSFDCDRPKGEIETLICGDDELAALDVDLAKAFAGALARSPANNVQDLRSSQDRWVKARNACRQAEDQRACAIEAYRKRLGEI